MIANVNVLQDDIAVDEDGSVRNVSAGTAVMYTADDYKVISTTRVQG